MNLYQRIIQVYKQVSTVIKDDEISVGNNSYLAVSHDAVIKALHGPIAENGIVVIPSMLDAKIERYEKEKTYNGQTTKQEWFRVDCHVSVKFLNADKPEEQFETKVWSYALDTSDKAMGKAYTYAIKMIYLKVFMLESADQEEQRIYEQEKPKTNTYNQTRQPQPAPVLTQKEVVSTTIVNHAPQASGAKPLSEPQVKRLYAIASKNNWVKSRIDEHVFRNYKTAAQNLSREQYDEVCSFFEANEDLPF